MQTKISGTKEWADKNENLFKGKCPTGCIYCYEHSRINWLKLVPDYRLIKSKLTQKFEKRNGVTMYPSQHDIHNDHVELHLQFINSILSSGSKLLVVTKGCGRISDILLGIDKRYRELVELRFTVGSVDDKTLKFYEPKALTFGSRMTCLVSAFSLGYSTSLSIEPMLDEYPDEVVKILHPFVSGDIWIGKMNRAVHRVSMNGHKDKLAQVRLLDKWQSNDANILGIVNRLSHYPNIKWKDSIQQVIERNQL